MKNQSKDASMLYLAYLSAGMYDKRAKRIIDWMIKHDLTIKQVKKIIVLLPEVIHYLK